jgi:hypothetical protein
MSFSDEDFEKLEHRIDTLFRDKIISTRSEGLVHLLFSQKFLRDADEIQDAITDGANDCGVDAVLIDRRSDQPVVHIVQSKLHESKRKASNPFKASALEKVCRFFEILRSPEVDLHKIANPRLVQKILEIRQVQTDDFPIYKTWLVSNGTPCLEHEIAPLRKQLAKNSIEIEEFHLHEFIEFCINKHSRRLQHVFRTREAGVLESGDTELYSVVGYISARELYDLLRDLSDERKMDFSLFDMNVRGFLGMNSSINQEIVKSAASRDNAKFSSLNNGITMIGTDVKVMKMTDQAKIGVKKLSIVNGAQTCSAIFDCMKDQFPDFQKFDKLSVLFRLFKTDDLDTIEKISLSTNSQNRIHPRDLRANDKFQVSLERELAKRGIKYFRKRGSSSQSEGDAHTLDALKAGQLLVSYVHLDPAGAKKQSDQIFQQWYGRIFGNVDVAKLVRAFELFRLIEEKQKYISDEIRIRGIGRIENTFVTYGGFHILTIAAVLETISNHRNDDELIEKAIKIIAEVLTEAGQPAFYSFFRNPEMTNQMIAKCAQLRLI